MKKQTEMSPEDDIVAKTLRAKNSYVKHLCECRCVLPQFVDSPVPRFHQFVVFSMLDENMEIIPSTVKCNYCGAVSTVSGIGTLKPSKAEQSSAVETPEEIQDQLPPELIKKLSGYVAGIDLPTWQEIRHIYENEYCWGVCPVVLAHDPDPATGSDVAKVLNILGRTMYNVRTVSVN